MCLWPQESLGGSVRVMVTGAAPISPAVLSFLRACLGCQVKNLLWFHFSFSLWPSHKGFYKPSTKLKRYTYQFFIYYFKWEAYYSVTTMKHVLTTVKLIGESM